MKKSAISIRVHLIISALLTLTLFNSCNGQENETYWRIENIYREDKKPFIGLTAHYMQEIFDYNFHFTKRNDSLYFDLPKKFALDLKNFKNLRQLSITDRDYYEMYDYKFSGNSFIIKFIDKATISDSKNTIIEFKKISKVQFEKSIEEVVAQEKEIARKINALKNELVQKPPIVLNEVQKLPSEHDLIYYDKVEDYVELSIPEEIELRESGSIKNKKFADIKIGTFKDNSRIYDIKHSEKDYGLKQLTIYVSTDSSNFDIEKYVSENPNMVLVKKTKDNIVGYTISYDFENEKAVIGSFFTLKYYKVGKAHVFIHSDVYCSQMKNDPNYKEMNEILNFNYLISENITLYKNDE